MEETDDRVPCADDLCTGTLDPAGVCGYCGRSASGVLAADAPQSVEEPEAVLTAASDGERLPCGDDLCTGTVNEHGVCNYCGRPYMRSV